MKLFFKLTIGDDTMTLRPIAHDPKIKNRVSISFNDGEPYDSNSYDHKIVKLFAHYNVCTKGIKIETTFFTKTLTHSDLLTNHIRKQLASRLMIKETHEDDEWTHDPDDFEFGKSVEELYAKFSGILYAEGSSLFYKNLIKDQECPVLLVPLRIDSSCRLIKCGHLLSRQAAHKMTEGDKIKCPLCRAESCCGSVDYF